MTRHKCERFHPPHRGQRRCRYCNRVQFFLPDKTWAFSMTLNQFANNWLPAVSGTSPINLMRVDVAFPFEWNCYESWNVVFRVTFDEREGLLATRTDVMKGWQSSYHEDFVRIDFEARREYEKRTGRSYDIGDNTYEEMRRIIQS